MFVRSNSPGVSNYATNSILVILTFLVAVYGKRILQLIVTFDFDSPVIKMLYAYSWWVIPVTLTTGYLFGFKNVIRELCLHNTIWRPLGFALIAASPMLISSAIMGGISSDLNLLRLLNGTLFAGFMEEMLFRGFLFGLLFRRLGWGFIPASLVGALVFGLGHIYQGGSSGEMVGIFLVTFIGAAWFAWLFIEWNENLWVPIFLHILMNLSWTLFDMSDNALGGIAPNLFRAITIAITVILTIRNCKRRDEFRINRKTLFSHLPQRPS